MMEAEVPEYDDRRANWDVLLAAPDWWRDRRAWVAVAVAWVATGSEAAATGRNAWAVEAMGLLLSVLAAHLALREEERTGLALILSLVSGLSASIQLLVPGY